ncbi:hypothetical protein SAMD00019534_036310 [Acytostelium subglobosum LB1]|uniref:hypothetical protein n=1 Tax=Acytostelium subglobosum LB1 TaxID=1410327 RepID=UPI0006448BB7|nr:hypothetical protein SAMD00019534_036310 [Acytostelium subglobosum LB1]GAM20456.1 hypothetical protein SAMD00019534_036310 [Acytostelium subglobosum LB1]|eukprot:XP_012759977.1 hypothetical protein SAMD00019534_036310 [Acytostelium subglobosum LB1]
MNDCDGCERVQQLMDQAKKRLDMSSRARSIPMELRPSVEQVLMLKMRTGLTREKLDFMLYFWRCDIKPSQLNKLKKSLVSDIQTKNTPNGQYVPLETCLRLIIDHDEPNPDCVNVVKAAIDGCVMTKNRKRSQVTGVYQLITGKTMSVLCSPFDTHQFIVFQGSETNESLWAELEMLRQDLDRFKSNGCKIQDGTMQ